jgi:putative membrane protein
MIILNISQHVHENSESLSHIIPQLSFTLLFCSLFILYIGATIYSNRRYKRWPLHRTICWTLGIIFALIALTGPLVNRAPMDFTAHMLSHLLLGMLAPLLMVVAAPMTLVLRTISIPLARVLSNLLRSWPSQFFTHPIVATFLNIGGLWLLYTSNIYALMHENIFIHLIVHFHLFLAGYLFTIAIVPFDSMIHRKSFLYRAIVLIIALAGHGILSKYIYAHPPEGVPIDQAELGSMLMFYGGDIIDAIIIFLLCLQWFRATRPRVVETLSSKEGA